MANTELELLVTEIRNNISLSIDDIKDLLKPTILNIDFKFCFLDPNPNDIFLFRGRKLDSNFAKQDAKFLKNLSYIPEEKKSIAPKGRANREGFPIFYCSDGGGPSTVCWETKCFQSGDELIITSWKPNRILPLSNIADCPHGNDISEIVIVLKELFTDDNNYDISIAVTELLTEGEWSLYYDKIQQMMEERSPCGIRYPSIAKSGYGTNCAILPKYVDSHMDFVAAQHIRVKEVFSDKIMVDVLDFAHDIQNGELKWWGSNFLEKNNNIVPEFESVERRDGPSKHGFAQCGPGNVVYHRVIVGSDGERIVIE
ncbi:MAG: hypothetical protein KGQ36_06800 [Rickettsiales bacterium]|nr:hypothetical protein [Rickettsiales bacterium]